MFWSPVGVYGLIQYPEEAEKHLQQEMAIHEKSEPFCSGKNNIKSS